ncbi:MAG TPA: DoxX family protein [Anaerolineaceae bacterium]|nr:DoxX family protein [Anaerolineaceae bacterium]
MNTALWIIQIILSIKLMTTAYSHGLRQDQATMREARLKLGRPGRALLYATAIGTTAGALGLILPGVIGTTGWMTPTAAAWMSAMLLGSILCHVRSREKPKIFVSIVLFVFAALVAYGRWVVMPL